MSIFKVINPGDNPNEGRVKINYNFDLLGSLSGGGAGELIIGAPITGGTPTEVLYTDNYGNLYSDGGFTRDSITSQTDIINDYDPNNSISLNIGGYVPAAIFTINDNVNDFTNFMGAINNPPNTPNSSLLYFRNNNTGDISILSATQNNGGNPIAYMATFLQSGEFSDVKVYSSGITLNVSGTPFNLMSQDGASGQAIITDGNGQLSFSNVISSPGGYNTNIQFNDNGYLNGVSAFTFNKLTNQFNFGQGNSINYNSYGSSIIGGGFLNASPYYGSVTSGHSIYNSVSSSIIGGGGFYGGFINLPNKIYNSSSGLIHGSIKSQVYDSGIASVFSSNSSKIYQASSSLILGSKNSYLNNSRQSSIINGDTNYNYGSHNSSILSGKYNTLNSSFNSAIIGGNNLNLNNEDNTVLMQNMRADVVSGNTFYSGSTPLTTIIENLIPPLSIGQNVSGGTNAEVLYTDNSGNLFSDSGFTRDSSTKNTTILVDDGYGASNGFNITNAGVSISTSGTNWNWMTGDGSNGQVITTDGTGNLSFKSITNSGDQQVLFNSNGTITGNTRFIFDYSKNNISFNQDSSNTMGGSVKNSLILGGLSHTISSSANTAILIGGSGNVTSSSYSTIIAGLSNSIDTGSTFSSIISSTNCFMKNSTNSVMLGCINLTMSGVSNAALIQNLMINSSVKVKSGGVFVNGVTGVFNGITSITVVNGIITSVS